MPRTNGATHQTADYFFATFKDDRVTSTRMGKGSSLFGKINSAGSPKFGRQVNRDAWELIRGAGEKLRKWEDRKIRRAEGQKFEKLRCQTKFTITT